MQPDWKVYRHLGYVHNYPYVDHMISRDNYPASLSIAANLSLICSFTVIEYTNTEYTDREYKDIELVYGEALANGRAARRIYQEHYSHRVTPSHTLFAKLFNCSEKEVPSPSTGQIVVLQGGVALPTLKRTYCIALKRLQQRVPENCAWKGCASYNSTVWEVHNEQQLHAFHVQRVHVMGPADFALRINFYMWLLHRCVEKPRFPRQILFTVKSRFSRYSVLNSRSSHVSDGENLHAQHAHGFQ